MRNNTGAVVLCINNFVFEYCSLDSVCETLGPIFYTEGEGGGGGALYHVVIASFTSNNKRLNCTIYRNLLYYTPLSVVADKHIQQD